MLSHGYLSSIRLFVSLLWRPQSQPTEYRDISKTKIEKYGKGGDGVWKTRIIQPTNNVTHALRRTIIQAHHVQLNVKLDSTYQQNKCAQLKFRLLLYQAINTIRRQSGRLAHYQQKGIPASATAVCTTVHLEKLKINWPEDHISLLSRNLT